MSTGNLNIGNGQQQIPAPMAGGAARIDGLARSPPSRQSKPILCQLLRDVCAD